MAVDARTRGALILRGLAKVVKAAQEAKRIQAANTENMAQPASYNSGGGGGGGSAAPVSTLASIPQTPLLQDLISKGLIKEGMPPEQALAILQFGQLGAQGKVDIQALMDQVKADYENYTGDILTAGQGYMNQLMGTAYDPNDPNARLFAQDPIFSTYAGGMAQMDETADQNLATDLAWFTKNQAAQDQYYNDMMTAISTGTLPIGAAAGGGGGGYGGGGGRRRGGGYGGGGGGGGYGDGINSELGFGDLKTIMQSVIEAKDQYQQKEYENFPGFWDMLSNSILSNPAFAAEPQMQQDLQDWLTNIGDQYGDPEGVRSALADEQIATDAAIQAGMDAHEGNVQWLQGAPTELRNLISEWQNVSGKIIGDNPATPEVETSYDNPNTDPLMASTTDPMANQAFNQRLQNAMNIEETLINPLFDQSRYTNINTGGPQVPVASDDVANLINSLTYINSNIGHVGNAAPSTGAVGSASGAVGPVDAVLGAADTIRNQGANNQMTDVIRALTQIRDLSTATTVDDEGNPLPPPVGMSPDASPMDEVITRASIQDAIKASGPPAVGMDWNTFVPPLNGQWAGPPEDAPEGANLNPIQAGQASDAVQSVIRAARNALPFGDIFKRAEDEGFSQEWIRDAIRSRMGLPMTPTGTFAQQQAPPGAADDFFANAPEIASNFWEQQQTASDFDPIAASQNPSIVATAHRLIQSGQADSFNEALEMASQRQPTNDNSPTAPASEGQLIDQLVASGILPSNSTAPIISNAPITNSVQAPFGMTNEELFPSLANKGTVAPSDLNWEGDTGGWFGDSARLPNKMDVFNRALLGGLQKIQQMPTEAADPENMADIDAAVGRLQQNMLLQGYSPETAAGLQLSPEQAANNRRLLANYNYEDWADQNEGSLYTPEAWNQARQDYVFDPAAVGGLRQNALDALKNVSIAAQAAHRQQFGNVDEESYREHYLAPGQFWNPEEPTEDEMAQLIGKQFAIGEALPAVRDFDPDAGPAVVYNSRTSNTSLADKLTQMSTAWNNDLNPLTATGQRLAAAIPEDISSLMPYNPRPEDVDLPQYDLNVDYDSNFGGSLGDSVNYKVSPLDAILKNLPQQIQQPQPVAPIRGETNVAKRKYGGKTYSGPQFNKATAGAKKLAGIAKIMSAYRRAKAATS